MDTNIDDQLQKAEQLLQKAESLHERDGNIEEVHYKLKNVIATSVLSIAKSINELEQNLEKR